MAKKLIIRLESCIRMFATSRTQRDLVYLGTVQSGIEIGALAQTATGQYVQVNGDFIKMLNKSKVENALTHARHQLARLQAAAARSNVIPFEWPAPVPREQVLVIVKKRRTIVRA